MKVKIHIILKVIFLWILIPLIIGIFIVPKFVHCSHGFSIAEKSNVERYGMVIHVKPEKIEEYKRLHANVWPEVLQIISKANIRNYSIYLKDSTLFSYFEYVGKDFNADMEKMAADPATQKWWDVCKPCQSPLDSREEGEWWANMEEVFHYD